jgi:stage II sporulation protein M
LFEQKNLELRRWLFIAAALLCGGLVLGLMLPGSVANDIEQNFQNLARSAASAQGLSLFFLIFINNALAVSASFLFSPVFLILPVVSILLNGALITVVSRLTLQDHSLGFLIAGILPHGIIEIPAYLIGQAAAICFGTTVIRSLFNPERRAAAGPVLRMSLRWLGLAIALLIPAALIEAFITPVILGWFK